MKGCKLLIGFFLLMPLFGISQITEKACFSVPGGFYEESPTLEIFPFYQQHHIRFTTNGNRPTAQSRLYTEPLLLDESLYSTSDIYTINLTPDSVIFIPDSVRHCIVIRAAVFDEMDNCISEVTTNSYFIHSLGCHTHGLPVVSLCADSLDLYDTVRGILVPGVHFDPQNPLATGNYYETGLEWERPVSVEYYEKGTEGINQIAGLRVQGKKSRRFQQKALKLLAREEYGKKRFDYPFFETTPINSFKHLTLKPFYATFNHTGINDYLANRIASQLELESLDSRPVVLFLNGEYWGIYFLHEKPDERFLEDHLGLDPEQVTILEGWTPNVDCGDPTNFKKLFQWMSEADLRDPDAYAYVASKIDIDNFIDYYIFELFSENTDWPANNTRCWQLNDGKWRWFFYDGDACFCWMTYYAFENAVYEGDEWYPSNRMASLFFRKLFVNEEFKEQFKNRFQELLTTTFSYANTGPLFEDIKNALAPEIPFQSERFDFPASVEEWQTYLGHSQWFLMKRCEGIMAMLEDFMHWSLPQNQQTALCVFPNPSYGQITIQFFAETQKNVPCCVYDVMGRQVFARTVSLDTGLNTVTLDLLLSKGCYLLNMDNRVVKIILK